WLVVAAETAEDEEIARLRAMGEGDPQLVLTAERAAALGLEHDAPSEVSLLLPMRLPATVLWHLADPTAARLAAIPADLSRGDVPGDIAAAVVELTKLARLLPAAIVVPLRLQSATHAAHWAHSRDLLDVSVGAIERYQLVAARSLRMVSEARVPLAGAENTRVLALPPGDGGTEHLPLIIGQPPPHPPLLPPLHSPL